MKPDLVGFSCMAFQYKWSLGLARKTKELNPNIITVFGGYYTTIDSDSILNSDDMNYVDYLIRGEGETCFNELIKGLINKDDLSKTTGLCFRNNGIIINNENECIAEINDINLPDRTSRILKKGFNIMGLQSDAIETSRGCVYNCNFCSIKKMYGNNYRKYNTERVLEDIRNAKNRGAKALMMTDDNITLDGNRYKEMCEAIVDAKLNDVKVLLQASVNGIKRTAGLAKSMADSGVRWVFLGIENANDNTLESMNKSVQLNTKDTAEVVQELNSNGIIVIGGFIIGYPEDNEDTIRQNFAFAKKIGIDIPVFNTLTPYPNTPIRSELLKENLITNKSDYSKYDCWEVNIRTRYLSTKQIYDIRYELEARYPLESGALWRMTRKYPWYFLKLIPKWILTKPKDFFKFLKGFKNYN